jgi:uncharacterized linocin/CFP29 family protein
LEPVLDNPNAALGGANFGGSRLQTHARRPFIGKDGLSYIPHFDTNSGKWGKIRVNATALLQYDEWKDIDRTVIEIAVQRMTAVNDLRGAGLEHNLGGIGATLSLWDRSSDMSPAAITMDARNRSQMDTPAYATQMVPVPVVHKDFNIEARRLEASRRFGESIDTTAAAIAGRVVAEATETMLFSGASINVDGNTIYGYLTHPDRNQVTLTTPWSSLDGTAGANVAILSDVLAMVTASRVARFYGPWVLYIPSGYESKMDEDFKGGTSSDTRTVRQRLMAVEGLTAIRVSDFLPANNVVLVSLNKEVVDLAVGQDVTTVQWSNNGGMSEEFKVMAVWVPRIKSDFDGRSGITHLH